MRGSTDHWMRELGRQLNATTGLPVRQISLAQRGEGIVVRCLLANRTTAVRLSTRPREWIEQERRILAALAGSVSIVRPLDLPQPLELKIDETSYLASMFVWEEGPVFHPAEPAYYEAAAVALAQIHTTAMPDVGRAAIEKFARSDAERSAIELLPSPLRSTVIGNLSIGIPSRQSLIHGDPIARNFIDTCTGPVLIDFGDAGLGHPEYDVGAVLYQAARHDVMSLWPSFERAYCAAGGIAELRPEALRHAVTRYVLFVLNWLETHAGGTASADDGAYMRWVCRFLASPSSGARLRRPPPDGVI